MCSTFTEEEAEEYANPFHKIMCFTFNLLEVLHLELGWDRFTTFMPKEGIRNGVTLQWKRRTQEGTPFTYSGSLCSSCAFDRLYLYLSANKKRNKTEEILCVFGNTFILLFCSLWSTVWWWRTHRIAPNPSNLWVYKTPFDGEMHCWWSNTHTPLNQELSTQLILLFSKHGCHSWNLFPHFQCLLQIKLLFIPPSKGEYGLSLALTSLQFYPHIHFTSVYCPFDQYVVFTMHYVNGWVAVVFKLN